MLTEDAAKGFYIGCGLTLAALAVGVQTLRPPSVEFRLTAEQAKYVKKCDADLSGASATMAKVIEKMRNGERNVVISFADLAASGASAGATSKPGCVKPPITIAPGS
jgi:hypothetical protein